MFCIAYNTKACECLYFHKQ